MDTTNTLLLPDHGKLLGCYLGTKVIIRLAGWYAVLSGLTLAAARTRLVLVVRWTLLLAATFTTVVTTGYRLQVTRVCS